MAKTTKPYKMTPERVAIILEGLANGMTQRDCAMLAGIHEDTLCGWKCNNSEFSEQMGQKAVEYKQKLLKRITDAGEKDWKASAWILEHKYKNDFSPNANDVTDLYDMLPIAGRGLDHSILAERIAQRFREEI